MSIHLVEQVLRPEFQRCLSDKTSTRLDVTREGVRVVVFDDDPYTGAYIDKGDVLYMMIGSGEYSTFLEEVFEKVKGL